LPAGGINILSAAAAHGYWNPVMLQSLNIILDCRWGCLLKFTVVYGVVFYQIHFAWHVFAEGCQCLDIFPFVVYTFPNNVFIGDFSLGFAVPIFQCFP